MSGTDRRIRLALIRQRYNPWGGAERFIDSALPALEALGIDVTLVARRWGGGPAAAGVKTRTVDPFYLGALWRDRSFANAARSLWNSERFDLVQSHERIAGCAIYRAGDGVHRRWLEIRTETAGALERLAIAANPYHRYVCAEEKRLFEHPAMRAVICNSRMVRDEVLRFFRVDPEKLHVIYNGVDTERFHPRHREGRRDVARRTLGVAGRQPLLAFVGSGFSRKGLDLAIKALARTRAAPALVVAGADRERRRFEVLARTEGLGGRVHFVGGIDDVRNLHAAADAFVLPTRYDPFPNAALEALASGLPVVVSDRCGVAEIVSGTDAGRVVPANDVAALAGAIDELFAEHPGRTAAAARALAEPLAIGAMAERLVALYRSLLGRPNP